MDEKFQESLIAVYDSLTDEQKKIAKNCKTPEEMLDFAGREGIELPDDIVGAVTGGAIYENRDHAYEVIDDNTGDVIATLGSWSEAKAYANEHGILDHSIGWVGVADLRDNYKKSHSSSSC